MTPVSRGNDRVKVVFDEPTLVADAGLILVATLAARLGLETLINDTVNFVDRKGGFGPGRKILTIVHAMIARPDPHHPRQPAPAPGPPTKSSGIG